MDVAQRVGGVADDQRLSVVREPQEDGEVARCVAWGGDEPDAPVAEQVDGLRERAMRLAVAVEVDESHPRLGRQVMADVPLRGGEALPGGRSTPCACI